MIMFRKTGQRDRKIAAVPGTIIYTGFHAESTRISLISYDRNGVEEREVTDLDALTLEDGRMHWLNVTGLEDAAALEAVGRRMNIHPLTLEDISSITQRPKTEEFDAYLYYVLKMIYLDSEKTGICFEQVSLVLGNNFIVSFQ